MTTILFTHKGNPEHLKYVLAQADEKNTNVNIVLLGDRSNNIYPFITHAYLEEYFEGARHFAGIYQHMNSTSIDFELFCYQRWFCIYEYMCMHGIKEAFCLDSDVLLYDSLSELQHILLGYDIACGIMSNAQDPGCWIAGPPLLYAKREALKELLDFFCDSYQNPSILKKLEDKMKHHAIKKEPYGICDMTQIYLFIQEKERKPESCAVCNLFVPFIYKNENAVIDITILSTEGYIAEGNRKKLTFEHNTVYAYKESGERIRLPLIHFQGYYPVNAKEWIPTYYLGKRYRLNVLYEQVQKKFHYYRKKIKRYLLELCS